MEKPSPKSDVEKIIVPEIIYIQYEHEGIENLEDKIGNDKVLIQVSNESNRTNHEYHDEPELFAVHGQEAIETQNPIYIQDYSGCSLNYDNEINSAVRSINCEAEADIRHFPNTIMMEINEAENNPILMYACTNIDDQPINKYPCDYCHIVLGCIFCLKSHYESVHLKIGILQYQCTQIMNNLNQGDVCPKCRLICATKEVLMEHRKIHFVKCDVCDMSFDSPLFLWNHCKTNHDNFDVILTCDFCEESFKEMLDLSDHYQTAHQMIACIVCLKRFRTKRELEVHHKTHRIVLGPEPPMPFACSLCDMAFNSITLLSKHLNTEHTKKRKIIVSNSDLGNDICEETHVCADKIVKIKKV